MLRDLVSAAPTRRHGMNPVESTQASAPETARKPYVTPELTVHGNVEALTESTGAGGTDMLTKFT